MTEKRFTTNGYKIYDTFHDGVHWLVNQVEANEIVDKMNNLDLKARERSKALSKLQKENEQLRELLNIGRKNAKAIIDVLNEQEKYKEENEQLKQQIKKLEAQLYKVEDGVCDICNNMYLVQQGRYFVSKCKKGHDECSKMDLDYCDDFELKDGDME